MDRETPNDFNDRAIVHTTKYLSNIIHDEDTKVLFITNDIANKVQVDHLFFIVNNCMIYDIYIRIGSTQYVESCLEGGLAEHVYAGIHSTVRNAISRATGPRRT